MATAKQTYKGSDRVTAGSILFSLTRAGKAVSVKTAKEAFKKAGRKVTNFDNRIYWFSRNMQENHGMEAVYDREKGTIKLVKATGKSAKKSPSKAKTSKTTKKATAKPRPAHKVEVESDETVSA